MKSFVVSVFLLAMIIWRSTGELTQWTLVALAFIAWSLGFLTGLAVEARG